MTACEFAELDGSYVLGALSPAERLAYEEHLATCADCARSVRELAGLPGLLARVDPLVLEPAPPAGPVPDTLLPALVREVGRTRRRRLWAVAAAAVAAVLVLGGVLVQTRGNDTPTSPPAATATTAVSRPMQPVGHVPVTASLAFTPVAWGTRLDLQCTYRGASSEYQLPRTATYALYVVSRDGRAEQVGTWQATSGKPMHFSAGTAARRSDIADVEVRTLDGRPVLRLGA